MLSKARTTEVGSELESFLDHFNEDIPPRIFKELEELGDILDEIENGFVEEISELKSKLEDLEREIDEKKDEIEELEIKLSEVEG